MYIPSNILHPMINNITSKLRHSLAFMLVFAIALIVMGNNPIKAQDQVAGKNEEQFLNENSAKDGVETTESGLQFQTIQAGEGASPTVSDIAFIGYKGMFTDGTVFDENPSAPLPVGQLVPGFSEALQKMQIGGEYKIWIPSKLGYGLEDRINPQTGEVAIPGGSTLVFEVKLIDFKSQAEIAELRSQITRTQSKSFEEIESALEFQTIIAGEGPSPKRSDMVLVSYKGMLADGRVFDENPYTVFTVNQLISGFSVALQKMQVGGQYKVGIPSEFAYGPEDRINPQTGEVSIPGGSTLIFEVSLLHFKSQTEVEESSKQAKQTNDQ